MRVLMTPMLAGPRHSSISVDGFDVEVKMGVGGWMFSSTVPRESITVVNQIAGPVWGWGAHGWRGTWLVNGSSKGLVRLTISPKVRGRTLGFPLKVRTLILSLDDPGAFVEALDASTR